MSLFLSFSLYVAHSLFLPPQTQSLYLSLTLSPTLSLFVSFSLSHPTSTFFLTLCGSDSFSQHVSIFIFSLCLPCSLSLPTLSLFQSFSLSLPTLFCFNISLSHPCLFLYLPPCFFSTLSLILSFSLPTVSLSILLPPPHCLFLFHHASLSLSSSEALSQREGKIETG